MNEDAISDGRQSVTWPWTVKIHDGFHEFAYRIDGRDDFSTNQLVRILAAVLEASKIEEIEGETK